MTGHWEPVITSYIRAHLKSGDIFLDVGANIGYYSLLASRIVGHQGKVFAIEASPSIHKRLMRNVGLNRYTNIKGINAAASSKPGELSIFLADAGNLGHSTTVETLAEQEGMTFEAKVPADTLENLVGLQNLRNARFVKIDVEGHEIGVLAPLFESLDKFSLDTEWLVELSPGFGAAGQSDVDRIYGAFVAAGYTAYRIPNTYGSAFARNPPKQVTLTPLTEPPTVLTDVVMSRRHR
jgi:FkbM family methyltransferase